MKRKPNRRTVRDAIRASVPEGKLKGARIVLKDDTSAMAIGGFTEYDRAKGGRVTKLGAPASDDSFGVSIRAHEAAHASHHKPTRKRPMTEVEATCAQIIDDVNIESIPVPSIAATRAYRRAKLSVAMREVRNIVRIKRRIASGDMPDKVEIRNANLCAATRAIAMLRSYGQGDAPEVQVRQRAFSTIRNTLGHRMTAAVGQVARVAVARRSRAKALSMLVALMESEILEDIPEETGERQPDGEIISPVQEGNALDGQMKLIDLRPKSEFCAKEKRVSRRYSPSGVILNPTRYVAAIVSGISNGLFSRRVRQEKGGCVVIDASGSMGASATNLKQICALVPTATLGYYSGTGYGKGQLCIYAKDGKRYSGGELPPEYLQCGNAVDLAAIRWMMKHAKPWILVSDLQFCGGVLGSEIIAKALIERAVAHGDLTVYRSLDEAYAAFGGKGELKN